MTETCSVHRRQWHEKEPKRRGAGLGEAMVSTRPRGFLPNSVTGTRIMGPPVCYLLMQQYGLGRARAVYFDDNLELACCCFFSISLRNP